VLVFEGQATSSVVELGGLIVVGETRFEVVTREGTVRFPRSFVQVDTSNHVVHVLELDDTIELTGAKEVSHDGVTRLDDQARATIFLTSGLREDVRDVRHEDNAAFTLARTLEANEGVGGVRVDVLVQLDLTIEERTSVSNTTSRLHGSISTEIAVRDVDTVVQRSDSSADVRGHDGEVTGAHTSRKSDLTRNSDDGVHDASCDGFGSPTTLSRTRFSVLEVNNDDLFTTEAFVLSNHDHGHEDFTVDVLLDFELEAFEQESFNVLAVCCSHVLLEFERVMALDGASTDADSTRNHLDGCFLDVVSVLTEFIITIVGETTEVVVEVARIARVLHAISEAGTFLSTFGVVGEHFASARAVRVEGRCKTGVVSDQIVTDFLLLAITEGSRLERFVIVQITQREVNSLWSSRRDDGHSVHSQEFRELTANERKGILLVLSHISGDVGRFELGTTVDQVLVFKKHCDCRSFPTVAERATEIGFKDGLPLTCIGLVLDNLHCLLPFVELVFRSHIMCSERKHSRTFSAIMFRVFIF